MKEQRFDKNVYMEFFYWLYQSLASSLCFWCVNILYIAAAFLLSIDGRNVFSLIFSLLFIGPGCIVMIGMTEELAKEKKFFISTFVHKDVSPILAKGIFLLAICLDS